MPNPEKEIIPITMPDGGAFLLEISSAGQQDFKKVSGKNIFEHEQLAGSITALSTMLGNAVKAASPDKFSLEFGIEISAKAGQLLALLCSSEGKANLKVTLEWNKDPQSKA
jgi:hypothetical protein